METKKNTGIKTKNPLDYKNAEFGKVVLSFDLIKSDKQGFAEVFSEGSLELKKLLLHMWDNDIETVACCTGHKRESYYAKDTLFGEKRISENDYKKHASSSRYHHYHVYERGYFTIKLNADLEKLRVLSGDIQKRLEEFRPYIPCTVSHQQAYGQNRITIHLDKFVPKAERERFFSNVSNALSQVLELPQKDVTKTVSIKAKESINEPMKRKNSLDKLIVQAGMRVETGEHVSRERGMEL